MALTLIGVKQRSLIEWYQSLATLSIYSNFFFCLYVHSHYPRFYPSFPPLKVWVSCHLRNSATLIYYKQNFIRNSKTHKYCCVLYIILSIFINSTYTFQKCLQSKFIQARSSLLWVMMNHSLMTCYFKNIFKSIFCSYLKKKIKKFIEYIWILFKSIIDRIHLSCFKNQLYLLERNLCLQQLKFYYTEIRFRKTERPLGDFRRTSTTLQQKIRLVGE